MTNVTDPVRMTEINDLEIKIVRLEEKLGSSEKALDIAKIEINRRLLEMNEMRNQINAERGIYLTKLEYYAKHDILLERVAAMQKFQWAISGGLLALQFIVTIFLSVWKK